MDADRTGWVPLPDIGDTYRAERAGVHRDSIGRARRVSNWTAAALIVSTGAAALALAHQALPADSSGLRDSGLRDSGTRCRARFSARRSRRQWSDRDPLGRDH